MGTNFELSEKDKELIRSKVDEESDNLEDEVYYLMRGVLRYLFPDRREDEGFMFAVGEYATKYFLDPGFARKESKK